jgi:hypothetical protein
MGLGRSGHSEKRCIDNILENKGQTMKTILFLTIFLNSMISIGMFDEQLSTNLEYIEIATQRGEIKSHFLKELIGFNYLIGLDVQSFITISEILNFLFENKRITTNNEPLYVLNKKGIFIRLDDSITVGELLNKYSSNRLYATSF